MTKQALEQRINVLETAIRKHRAAQGQDLCWLNDIELWDALGDGVTVDRQVPPWPEFIAGCVHYRQMLEKPPRVVEPEPNSSDVLWVCEHTGKMWHRSADVEGWKILCGKSIPGAPAVSRRSDKWEPPQGNKCKDCLRMASLPSPESIPCNSLASCIGDLHDSPKEGKPILKTYKDYLKAHPDTNPWSCFLAYLFYKIDGPEGKVTRKSKGHTYTEQVSHIYIPKALKDRCHRDLFLEGRWLWGAEAHFENRNDVLVKGESGTEFVEEWKNPDLED